MQIDSSTIGGRIRQLRDTLTMTQQQLAEATGISHRSIAAWEAGEKKPGYDNLVKLARLDTTGRFITLRYDRPVA